MPRHHVLKRKNPPPQSRRKESSPQSPQCSKKEAPQAEELNSLGSAGTSNPCELCSAPYISRSASTSTTRLRRGIPAPSACANIPRSATFNALRDPAFKIKWKRYTPLMRAIGAVHGPSTRTAPLSWFWTKYLPRRDDHPAASSNFADCTSTFASTPNGG